jgi:hypothetical protein
MKRAGHYTKAPECPYRISALPLDASMGGLLLRALGDIAAPPYGDLICEMIIRCRSDL